MAIEIFKAVNNLMSGMRRGIQKHFYLSLWGMELSYEAALVPASSISFITKALKLVTYILCANFKKKFIYWDSHNVLKA